MMDVPLTELAVEFGSGGVLGLLIGWSLKKLVKLAAVVAGGLLLLLGILEAEGLITVHWGVLRTSFQNSAIVNGMPSIFADVLGVLPVGTGFVAGGWLGFKKG